MAKYDINVKDFKALPEKEQKAIIKAAGKLVDRVLAVNNEKGISTRAQNSIKNKYGSNYKFEKVKAPQGVTNAEYLQDLQAVINEKTRRRQSTVKLTKAQKKKQKAQEKEKKRQTEIKKLKGRKQKLWEQGIKVSYKQAKDIGEIMKKLREEHVLEFIGSDSPYELLKNAHKRALDVKDEMMKMLNTKDERAYNTLLDIIALDKPAKIAEYDETKEFNKDQLQDWLNDTKTLEEIKTEIAKDKDKGAVMNR